MPEKEYRGAVWFAVVVSVLAAMICAMALMEYSDNPASRQ